MSNNVRHRIVTTAIAKLQDHNVMSYMFNRTKFY